jgi:hypothetical protein
MKQNEAEEGIEMRENGIQGGRSLFPVLLLEKCPLE